MLDTLNTQNAAQGSFAVVAFALSIFNFLISLWAIKSIRALVKRG